MKTFMTFEEDEAYRQGRKDAQNCRRDVFRTSRMFVENDTPDKAYWIGYDEIETAKERERQRMREEEERYWNEENYQYAT